MLKQLSLALILLAGYAAAFEVAEEGGDGRLFLFNDDNNDNLIFTRNATAAVVLLSVLAIGALAFLAFAVFSEDGGFFKRQDNFHNQYQYQTNQYAYDQNQDYYRQKRGADYDNDLAAQMAQIHESFKLFDVRDEECKQFVACEASQIHRLEENGKLAKDVYRVMTNLRNRKQRFTKDPLAQSMLDAFLEGEANLSQGDKDACYRHRERCTNGKKATVF